MGRLGVSVLLLGVGAAVLLVGVFMLGGPWWVCAVLGGLLVLYATVIFDVGERPARSGR